MKRIISIICSLLMITSFIVGTFSNNICIADDLSDVNITDDNSTNNANNVVNTKNTDSSQSENVESKSDNNTSKKTIKILLVGNSQAHVYSQYVYTIAKQAGQDVFVGNAYINGKDLSVYYAKRDKSDYTFRTDDSSWTNYGSSYSLKRAVEFTDWDYILINHYSSVCGVRSSFYTSYGSNYLDLLSTYCKQYCSNKNVKFGYVVQWSYRSNMKKSHDSARFDFKKYYNSSPSKMYSSICSVTKQVVGNMDLVVPLCTTMENVRTSYVGEGYFGNIFKNNAKDPRHLGYLGSYLSGMQICSSIGINIDNIQTTGVSQVSDLHLPLLKKCVQDTNDNPYSKTQQTKVKPSANLAVTVTSVNNYNMLQWNAITDNSVQKIYIYRKKSGQKKYKKLKTLSRYQTSYTDKSIASTTHCSYKIVITSSDKLVSNGSTVVNT